MCTSRTLHHDTASATGDGFRGEDWPARSGRPRAAGLRPSPLVDDGLTWMHNAGDRRRCGRTMTRPHWLDEQARPQ